MLDLSNTPPGLYLVRGVNKANPRLGSNGAGKSTLVSEAPKWALTGKISRSQRPGDSVENRRASGQTEVLLRFALDRSIHDVRRTRNPNNLLLDGTKVEQRDVDAILPLSEAALSRTVIVDQFGDRFLDLRPEDKSRMFTETLGLDRWVAAADEASDRAGNADRQLQALLRKIDANKAALAEARDQFEAARNRETDFEKTIELQIAEAKRRLSAATAEAKDRRAALDIGRGKFGKISGTDRMAELNDRKTQLRRLQRALEVAAGQVAAAQRDIEQLSAQLGRYEEAKSVCPECDQRVDAKHLQEKRTTISGRLENARQAAKNAVRGRAAITAEIAGIEPQISALEAELVKFTAVQSEVAVLAEQSLAADREMNRRKEVLNELATRENPFTRPCDDLQARIKELRAAGTALKEQEASANEQLSIYQFWQKGFREIRLQQIDAALAELELSANRHAESLGLEDWRIAFATERETKRGSVSHGFSVFLYEPGREDPVSWDSYSGGEVQRWQLAVTFALSEVLLARAGLSTDTEILDEPSTHLSPEGVDELLVCLADRARELGRRIFVIDHTALDRGAFDGVITVTKTKERGTYVEDGGGVVPMVEPKRERVTL